MDLYHHDGQGNIVDMDGSGTITVADTIEESRKRDRESDDEDTGGTGGQPPTEQGSQTPGPSQGSTVPPTPAPAPSAPTPVQVAIATLQDIVFLFNPMVEQLIQDAFTTHNGDEFRALQAFHTSAQQAWNTIPANMQANGGNIHQWESAIEILNAAGHAVQFAAGAVRRDLVFDGYHDETGIRIWTHSRYDDSYSHPSLATKTQVIAHLAAIVNLKQVLKTQVDSSPGATYEGRLGYLEALKVTFDAYVEFAFDQWDQNRNQVLLDYLRAYEEYSSYLLVATNYHKGTFATWRPTTMPDIVNIPPSFGRAPYTRTLERMVHYKLGTPQFMDHEQKLSSSWRLVIL